MPFALPCRLASWSLQSVPSWEQSHFYLEVWKHSSSYRVRRIEGVHIAGGIDFIVPHHCFCWKTGAGANFTLEVHLRNDEWVWILEFHELNSFGFFLLREPLFCWVLLHRVSPSLLFLPAVATDRGSPVAGNLCVVWLLWRLFFAVVLPKLTKPKVLLLLF